MTKANDATEPVNIGRRTALGITAAALVTSSVQAASTDDDFRAPEVAPLLRWEFTARIEWDNGRHPTGVYSSGQRIYNTVAGGEFRGPRLRGTLLPGGGDWAVMNPADSKLYQQASGRSVMFDARYILRTDDGVHIYVTNRGGKFDAEPSKENPPTPSDLGMSTPMFDVPVGSRYTFLSHNIYVGISKTRATDTLLQVYRLIA